MQILDVRRLKHSNGSARTVSLTIQNKGGEERIIHVQTRGGMYREELGCMIYFLSESLSGWFQDNLDELNKGYFDDYESDIKKIIKGAEDFLNDR